MVQHLPAGVRHALELGDDERTAIVAALEEAGGNRLRASGILAMGRITLWRKMKHYGIGEGE